MSVVTKNTLFFVPLRAATGSPFLKKRVRHLAGLKVATETLLQRQVHCLFMMLP